MGKFDLNSLALEARKDGKAFRALLEASEYIIEREVKRFATGYNSCHYDEYQSEAISSLYNNLFKFNPEKGAFSSYITRCIDQAILDYIREKQDVMSIGSTKLNEIKSLNKARARIKEEGLDDTDDNLMRYSGINSKKTLETVKWAERVNGTLSLDNMLNDKDDSSFLDFEGEDSFEDNVYKEEEIRALYRAISNLSREERNIIVFSYGLFGNEQMSNKEMAKILKVSENTIVNRKNAIKAKIRIMIESWAA
ncbi:MAG: sigma-70 family RNA polymerase sigma factor [Candidatus Ornithospirochaeta sp.]